MFIALPIQSDTGIIFSLQNYKIISNYKIF